MFECTRDGNLPSTRIKNNNNIVYTVEDVKSSSPPTSTSLSLYISFFFILVLFICFRLRQVQTKFLLFLPLFDSDWIPSWTLVTHSFQPYLYIYKDIYILFISYPLFFMDMRNLRLRYFLLPPPPSPQPLGSYLVVPNVTL